MIKNLLWVVFGLVVALVGVIQSFKRGIPWGILFLVLWLGFFIYAIRHYRNVAERTRQDRGSE
jgi:bacteriorhodopsin